MTDYQTFVADFPIRAWKNYTRSYQKPTKCCRYEVTALLTACWAVFVVPCERLELLGKSHPSSDRHQESQRICDLVEKWCELKKKSLCDFLPEGQTALTANVAVQEWEWFQTVTGCDVKGFSGGMKWIENQRKQATPTPDPTMRSVLKCLRHGLAHTNIWTDPPTDDSVGLAQIQRIVIANYKPGTLHLDMAIVLAPNTLHTLADAFVRWIDDVPDRIKLGDEVGRELPLDAA